jgi:lipopolysaccharide/colanic/teichoic acid biosynthesis glycosyltransferase
MNHQSQETQVAKATQAGSPLHTPIAGVHNGYASLEKISFSVSKHMNHTNSNVAPERRSVDNHGQVPKWKRALDLLCILLALPLLLPVGLFIGLLITIVSDGPVLFKQERIGYRGRKFVCFKFRTMAVGSDSLVHRTHLRGLIGSNSPMTKMDLKGDGRLIPIGLLLRATGLDELPQVINVVRGDMSLVGPRPCMSYEYDQYLAWQKERFDALPGLTGLWQVSGKNRTTFDEMMRLDIRYARSQSLWLDVKIILKTIPALIIQVQDTRRERKRRATASLSPANHFSTDVGATDTEDGTEAVPSGQLAQSSTEERV